MTKKELLKALDPSKMMTLLYARMSKADGTIYKDWNKMGAISP